MKLTLLTAIIGAALVFSGCSATSTKPVAAENQEAVVDNNASAVVESEQVVEAAAAIAASAPDVESMLHDSFSDEELVEILVEEGYRVSVIEDGFLRIVIDGDSYLLLNFDDGDLQAYYSIRSSAMTHYVINEWNREMRLSRAYLDSDNDPVLESDLLANGGLTRENVSEFFSVFTLSVSAFKRFLLENELSG